MDIFCFPCSQKPGWPWDNDKVFMYTCQRCFQHQPCNDYAWRKPKTVAVTPAPKPKDLMKDAINSQSQCNLPRAKGLPPPPAQPVYPVDPPGTPPAPLKDFDTRMFTYGTPPAPLKDFDIRMTDDAVTEVPIPSVQQAPPGIPVLDNRSDADKALDAVQPNRKGIKMERVKK